ncbi:MAG: heavy-metal-associated domain-containing protein [Candidatus Limimorpha sp.]
MKKYHIEGMGCNHCRISAEKAILKVEGVISATVCLETGEACVEGSASKESVCNAVEEIGFKCYC